MSIHYSAIKNGLTASRALSASTSKRLVSLSLSAFMVFGASSMLIGFAPPASRLSTTCVTISVDIVIFQQA